LIPADELTALLHTYGVSEKERMVLSLALEGLPINDIAEQLEIMPEAARKRLGEVYRKFGIKGRGSGKLAKLQQILFAQYQTPTPQALSTSFSGEMPIHRRDIEWGNAPDLPQFFGREQELERLRSLILRDDIGLISIIGMKGIGKTALALRGVELVSTEFEGVFWRSLDGSLPCALLHAIQDFLIYVRGASLAHDEDCLGQLMDCLRESRFLLVFDGFESLISPELSESEDIKLAQDFIRRVGSERHQSCLVLTSRENPKEAVELEGFDYPVQTLMLRGLTLKAAKEILVTKHLENKTYWDELIGIFQGNPLALQLIAVRIRRFFGGNVGEFLKQETITLHQIDDLIAQQFQSLSIPEKEVLSWLALKDEALSFSALKSSLEWPGSVLLETLESLVRRSLVAGEIQFVIHPTVKKYIIHFLKQEADLVKLPKKNSDIHSLLERCLLLPAESP
jgi:DNA-binding CsgD family transcriptional regulator